MRQRSVHTENRISPWAEKQAWQQAFISNSAGEINAARIKSAKWGKEGIGGNIAIGAENSTGAFPEIGNHHDIGLVIAGAGFDPCFPLTHVIGCSQVCVSVTAADL